MSLNKYNNESKHKPRRGAHRKVSPYKPKRDFKSFVKFLLVAVVLIAVIDFGVFRGKRPYTEQIKTDYYAQKARNEKAIEEALPERVEFSDEELGQKVTEEFLILNEGRVLLPEKHLKVTKVQKKKEPVPPKKVTKKQAVKKLPKPVRSKFTGAKPKIAIVIDDVGMNIKQSNAAINLPSEVTLAMLPYAKSVNSMASKAKSKGHELIIHTPMEAMSDDVALGSLALRSDMDSKKFREEFNKISNSFEGYVGVNNHMGSRLTQNPQAMGLLMGELKKRGLYFLDSRTISTSIAAETAAQKNVPTAIRDVFLDHENTPEFVAQALKKTESVARRRGSAIAIGHPKGITMAALRQWIPTLEAKGFELVPLSAIINKPSRTVKRTKPQKALYVGKTSDGKAQIVEAPHRQDNIDVPLMDLDYVADITPAAGGAQEIGVSVDNTTSIKIEPVILDPAARPKRIQMFKEGQAKISYPVE